MGLSNPTRSRNSPACTFLAINGLRHEQCVARHPVELSNGGRLSLSRRVAVLTGAAPRCGAFSQGLVYVLCLSLRRRRANVDISQRLIFLIAKTRHASKLHRFRCHPGHCLLVVVPNSSRISVVSLSCVELFCSRNLYANAASKSASVISCGHHATCSFMLMHAVCS